MNAEALPAQVFGAVNAGPRDQVEIFAAAEARDNFHIAAADRGSEGRGRAAVGNLSVARYQGGDLSRVTAHPNGFRPDAVLAEKVLPLRDPKRDG